MAESDHRVTDALDYLRELVDHEISSVGISAGVIDGLSLEPAIRVLESLGRPDHGYRIVHVTGTNGKGSVCRMIEALVAATGLRVGSYVSPEGTVNERIRIDGRPIGDPELAEAVQSVRGVAQALDVELTAFEAVTLSALVAFGDAPVDVAVIEVGLLGRFDATNVIDGDVAVVTSVGADHTDFGPGWLDRVASEKAGILKPNSQAILGPIDESLIAHFSAEAPESLVRLGVEFDVIDDRVALGGRHAVIGTSRGSRYELFLPLHGAHQCGNAAMALEAVDSVLHGGIDPELVAVAFEQVEIPGRVEMVSAEPTVILDGAHNPDATAALGATLTESFTVSGRRVVVIGMLAGRDPERFLRALDEQFALDLVIGCDMAGPRGTSSTAMVAAAEAIGLPSLTARSIAAGVAMAGSLGDESDLVVVSGSFRVVDEARAAVAGIVRQRRDVDRAD